ncbi:hypothetical protein UFOVP174_33 [uncultured Caudovirales phage]|uniref:Uncharacterized protein n=1 Tax=uncultured Caudovirales phage TaxID=2100421 RepID=A0A6J7WB60_9CAUD|nr:hypothetical protein UFOVP174_33 [uncultured Caudovirales phage]
MYLYVSLKPQTMKKLNALLTISSVLIASSSLFFAMFGQFQAMLLGLSISLALTLFIK